MNSTTRIKATTPSSRFPSLIGTIFAVLLVVCPTASVATAARHNILMIAVDDLRPELGCYGSPEIISPNIDRLADSGRVFLRAYCQQAVCNPSRTSLMTGLRPDTIGVTGNHTHFRSKHPDVVTLPQHFKNHGYFAQSIGKIFHGVFPDGASKTSWDTMGDPPSWSVPTTRFGPRYYYTEDGIRQAQQSYLAMYRPRDPGKDDWTQKLVFGPMTEAPDVSDETLYDGKVARAAVDALRALKDRSEPFFLAVGFIKPHSPFVAPARYWEQYAEENMAISGDTELPENAPKFSGHGSGEIRRYTDQPAKGPIPESNQRRMRHGYYACISYIDAQVGKVLNALKTNGLDSNTIVVLFGDHGYHLGEHGLWGKTTNFELDTRVPLIVRTPKIQQAGTASTTLAELVDLYPTLSALAGLPVPDALEGTNLQPAVTDPAVTVDDIAISQYPRGKSMGYSLRTDRWRYTEWVDRVSRETVATELYEHSEGSQPERKNLASEPLSQTVVENLSDRLSQEIQLAQAPVTQQAPLKVVAGLATSFEECAAGGFQAVSTNVGRWSAEEGHVEIDPAHHRTGKHCLHILGGADRRVQLEVSLDQTPDRLTFHAERWTRREPFQFRIEQSQDGEQWNEIYNGDKEVQIGTFKTKVSIPLKSTPKFLRFTCTSPLRSGFLLDDLAFEIPTPQRVTKIEATTPEVPILVGLDSNPLIRFRIDTEGNLDPIQLTGIKAQFLGEFSPADIESVAVYYTQDSPILGKRLKPVAERFGLPAQSLKFDFESHLKSGANYFWLSCRLSKDADIDHRITVKAEAVEFSDKRDFDFTHVPADQRLGVAVRTQGQDSVHTCRIPGLATTNKGTLIGVYDLRYRGGRDLPGDIDVGMSRSTDGGRTWSPMQPIMDMGNDPKWNYDGIGDPAVLVDRKTGTIWVAATWSHGNRSWLGSGPGLKPDETGQLMLVSSDDDGMTWSQPINITSQVKKPEHCFILQGPGKGITMSDGTIVFAAQYQDPVSNKRLPHSTIIYSRDHGRTWTAGTGAFDDTTEAQVVELEPGTLMLNCRYNRASTRVVMITRDMGQTWERHSTSQRALIEPRACMASLINVDAEAGEDVGGWLTFSNPDSTSGRQRIMIKGSPDRGETWPAANRVLLDAGRGSGYSCQSMIDNRTIGILYEGSRAQMTFQRVPLSDVIAPENGTEDQKAAPQSSAESEEHSAALQMPQVFGSHMVLQSNQEIPVWGSSAAGVEVTVRLGNESRSTKSDKNGRWSLRMPSRPASLDSVQMTVASGVETLVFDDVLVGEVWLCAGQSNMEWQLSQSAGGAAELQTADQPTLRLLHLEAGARGSSGSYTDSHFDRMHPDSFCEGTWKSASAESARRFSGVAWFFGRKLQAELGVPVGLICPAVGGTPAEAWLPRSALQEHPKLSTLVQGNWLDNPVLGEFCRQRGMQNLLQGIQSGLAVPGDELGPNHSFKPGFMWEAGIAPLIPYGIHGAIWYQGESNAESPERVVQHRDIFELLVREWRQQWGQGNFPFLYVQLPALNRPDWPAFRDQQRRFLDQLDHVGMVVTMDVGHPSNVHPTDKKTVGERLATCALGTCFQRSHPPIPTGPLLKSVERKPASLIVHFRNAGRGLKTIDGGPPLHFEVAGDDGRFHTARARIIETSAIELSSDNVPQPVAARYAWIPFPSPSVNLTNGDGLPASPFSTRDESTLASQSTAEETRPNILLIVGEDHGCELSCYGDPVIDTPHIDALARSGVLFEKGYVTQSVCSPSRSTIFTGLYPHQNGQLGLATHQYGWFEKWPTTYSLLKAAGYRTGLIGKTHVIPADAVEAHVDFRFQKNSNFAKKAVSQYAVEAGQFFRDSPTPFFMTVNYPDAHWPLQDRVGGLPTNEVQTDRLKLMPYVGDPNPRLLDVARNYYNCMLRLDECVGQLLKELDRSGKSDNTLVVFIGDHGAQMARGKVTCYEGGMRVPYIVRWPGVSEKESRRRELVSTIDLLPTFADAAGVAVPHGLPGRSLRPVLEGNSDGWRQYLACERNCDSAHLTFPQRTMTDGRFKLIYSPVRDREDPAARYYRIHGASHWAGSPTDAELKNASEQTREGYARWLNPPEYQLYDLDADPHEWRDLASIDRHSSSLKQMKAAMVSWQQQTGDPIRDPALLMKLMDENTQVSRAGRRSPAAGWQYLKYLHPERSAGTATQKLEGRFQD